MIGWCWPARRSTRPGRPWLTAPTGHLLVQNAYPTLMNYNKPDRGGHFAAWEEPQLFSEELRAAFRSLR